MIEPLINQIVKPKFKKTREFKPIVYSLDKLNRIIGIIESNYDVKLSSKRRDSDYNFYRQAYYYLAFTYTNNTLTQIANAIDRKDHTTVIHGVSQAKGFIDIDKTFKTVIEDCKKKLGIENE